MMGLDLNSLESTTDNTEKNDLKDNERLTKKGPTPEDLIGLSLKELSRLQQSEQSPAIQQEIRKIENEVVAHIKSEPQSAEIHQELIKSLNESSRQRIANLERLAEEEKNREAMKLQEPSVVQRVSARPKSSFSSYIPIPILDVASRVGLFIHERTNKEASDIRHEREKAKKNAEKNDRAEKKELDTLRKIPEEKREPAQNIRLKELEEKEALKPKPKPNFLENTWEKINPFAEKPKVATVTVEIDGINIKTAVTGNVGAQSLTEAAQPKASTASIGVAGNIGLGDASLNHGAKVAQTDLVRGKQNGDPTKDISTKKNESEFSHRAAPNPRPDSTKIDATAEKQVAAIKSIPPREENKLHLHSGAFAKLQVMQEAKAEEKSKSTRTNTMGLKPTNK